MYPIPPQSAPSFTGQNQRSGCADQIGLFIAVAFLVGFTALGQTSAWSADELIFEGLIHPPFYSRTLVVLGFASIVWLPLVLLSRFWKSSRYHLFYRTWAFAATFSLLMAAARLVPITSVQASTALHLVLMLLFCLLFEVWIRRSIPASTRQKAVGPSSGGWLALAAGLIIGLPWIAWGSLGSPLDSLLALFEGLIFGVSAALILKFNLIQPLQQNPTLERREIFMSGFGAVITLGLMAVGLQINGFEGYLFSVVLGLVIPWFVLVWLTDIGWLEASVLIGVGAALPLMFVDPDELSMIISSGQGELLQWVNQASAISIVLGLLVAVGIFALRKKMNSGFQSRTVYFGTVIVLVIAGILYGTVGRAGFYGERLFVILKNQADLSNAPAMQDYNQRRQFVYHTLVATAQQSQVRLRQSLDRYHVTYKPYYLENGMEVWGGPLVRAWLAAQPDVDRILDNPELRPLPEPVPEAKGSAPAPEGILWNQKMIGADRVWNDLGVTGKGIVIGQSDSGVQGDHPDLAGNYRGITSGNDYNWIDPWNHSTSPVDIGGHGTHTLGIMAGTRTGIAPGATWFGCVNLARNLGNPSLYLDCMQFMLAPYPQNGDPFKDGDPTRSANVINNSWGCPDVEGCNPDALLPAVNALRAAGIFVVVSAGNNGYVGCGTVTDPLAIYASVYTVGAVDPNGNLAAFSSLGPVTVDGSDRIKPDIVAPGDQVVSTFPNSSYQMESGTSMAGPHVVGVVALMWSANPKLIGDIDLTQSILDESAQAYRGNLPACVNSKQKPNDGVGWGLVDAYSAVKRAQQAK